MPQRSRTADFVALTKPGITVMSALMALGGLAMAPGELSLELVLWTLVGTSLAVASANAMNMVLEYETDALMRRTRDRPVAARRMPVEHATLFGILAGSAGVGLLATYVNPTTAVIGAGALVMYVFVYTPLKRQTSLSLLVGAVPGAAPPLMGWTAATDSITGTGIGLFAILFVWQLPHFLAIAIYSQDDYARAGIHVTPLERGDRHTTLLTIAYSTALVPVSLSLVFMGVASWLYGACAALAGAALVALAANGLWAPQPRRWARRFFLATLVYLPMLVVGLMADKVLPL